MSIPYPVPCILVALERERLFLHDTFRIEAHIVGGECPTFVCTHKNKQVLIVETGVGEACARRAVDWLLKMPMHGDSCFLPSFLLFAGFAGALDDSVHVGDVILAREVLDTAGCVWPASGLATSVTGAIPGRLLTCARFIGEPAEKLALGKKHNALAVDMESAAFAQRCTERGIPWACLRVISDDVSTAFTTEIAGLVEDGHVALGPVLWLLARKPWVLPKLLRLARQTRFAARRLADAVIQFLACSSAG